MKKIIFTLVLFLLPSIILANEINKHLRKADAEDFKFQSDSINTIMSSFIFFVTPTLNSNLILLIQGVYISGIGT